MNLRQLKAFRSVMTTGSVTGAAELLGISQPATTNLIANLERDLGFVLFERRHGRVFPTPEARYLHDRAEKSFSALDQLALAAEEIRELKTGQLRIACYPAGSSVFLPSVIADFVADRPRITISLQTRSSLKIKEMIAAQQFDVGLAEMPVDDPAIETEALSMKCVCVLPKGHPLTTRRTITPKDLDGVPMISLNRDHMTTFQVEQAFRMVGVKRDVHVESRLFGPACAMTARGVGVSIVDPIVAADYKGRGVVIRPFEPPISFDICIVIPAQRRPSQLATEFIKLLKARLTKYLKASPNRRFAD